jgi:hypothetical protein
LSFNKLKGYMEETKTTKVIRGLGLMLFWLVWVYGAYALWVSTGYNLAVEAAYREGAALLQQPAEAQSSRKQK